MSILSLYLLGPPRIEKEGVPVQVERKKAIALIAYLAVTGESQSRDTLVGLLWPKHDQTKSRASLRRDLSELKGILGSGWMNINREMVCLVQNEDLQVDVIRFRKYLSECRSHGHPTTEVCPDCVKPLTEALSLYRDNFLTGFSLTDSVNFDDWQFYQSEELHTEAISGLERLVNWHRDREELETVIDYARRWLELDRNNEVVHRHLIESYAKSGRPAAAKRQFEKCVKTLEKELGETPQKETVQLYESIKKNRTVTGSPSNKSLESPPKSNLPAQLTSFIGREGEIKEIKRLLMTNRLLMLSGAGGCGKTRLALEVAADLVEEYEDGVWLVDLAPLSDPDLVPQETASALDVREQPGRQLMDILSDYLRPKQILLVLDNCEHLIEACAKLTESILNSCPNLRILATSRESLGIVGETSWHVPSLTLPDPKHLDSIGSSELTEYEATGLLIDRMAGALPTFKVKEQDAARIAQICYRLDGIPLALELAAARAKVLSLEQIDKRLDDRFKLLTGGSRTALPRHRTLKATMDWSYGLLPKEESVVLNRLSVFAGGWTLAAAEAVCGGEGVEVHRVLDLITYLVDKSLVMVEEVSPSGEVSPKGEGDGGVRYRLLETVREYGWQWLVESCEEERIRQNHLGFFLALAEEAGPGFVVPDHIPWLSLLDAEIDNLRTALQWSHNKGENGLRLSGALGVFWLARGYWSEGREWLEKTLSQDLDRSSSVQTIWAQAKAYGEAGRLAWGQGDLGQAEELLQESMALYKEVGDKRGVAWSLAILGFVESDYGHATKLGKESLALSREIGDSLIMGWSLIILGFAEENHGNHERSKTLYEESLELFREEGNIWSKAWALNHLGRATYILGNYGRAGELLEESLALFRKVGEKSWGLVNSLSQLSRAALDRGDSHRAKALYEENLTLSEKLGNKSGIGWSLNGLGHVALNQGNYGQAVDLLGKSLALYEEIGITKWIPQPLEGLAGVALAQGQPERAVRLLGAAEAILEDQNFVMPPSHRTEFDRNVAAARAELDEEAFKGAWSQGRKMSTKEAIEYALKIDDV